MEQSILHFNQLSVKSPINDECLSLKIFLSKQTVQTLMKCHLRCHLGSSLFAKLPFFPVSRMKRVYVTAFSTMQLPS